MADVTLHMLPMPALLVELDSQLILSANDPAGDVLRISPGNLAGRPVDEVIVDWFSYMRRGNRVPVSGSRQFASRSRRADNLCFQGTWRIGPVSPSGDHAVAMLVHYPAVTTRHRHKKRIRADVGRPHDNSVPYEQPQTSGVDYLTGLGDRWVLESLVESALGASSVQVTDGFGLLLVDLDDFKSVNDRLGHGCGDRVLAIIAERLVAHVRPTDRVTRYGGDEFIVYAEPINSENDLCRIALRIRSAIAEPILLPNGELRLTASVGMALGSQSHTLPGLVEVADRGMYAAKRSSTRRSSTLDG
jgi:diguanylate cyclase (GGDEF)-like protein